MTSAADLPMAGFSVTIPHKQKIVRYWTWSIRWRAALAP